MVYDDRLLAIFLALILVKKKTEDTPQEQSEGVPLSSGGSCLDAGSIQLAMMTLQAMSKIQAKFPKMRQMLVLFGLLPVANQPL
jgi:hypothetical protein